jgi:hypothetical protein
MQKHIAVEQESVSRHNTKSGCYLIGSTEIHTVHRWKEFHRQIFANEQKPWRLTPREHL